MEKPVNSNNTHDTYEAPAIEFVEALEILAVACDDPTAKANPIDCPLGPANS